MKKVLGIIFLIFTFFSAKGQCDIEIAGFDPVSLEISIVVHEGSCGSATDSIGEFLLTLTFDPVVPNDENPFFCFNPDGTTDLLFPLNFPFVDIGEGDDAIIQGGDTLTFNLIESQPLGLGTTLCWQEAINSGAFDSCIVLFINQINDSGCLDGSCDGLGGFPYPDTNTEDNTIVFSMTDACGGLPPPPILLGCTDPNASNFNPDATDDDGSCEYAIFGCTDEEAVNYNPDATDDDGSCEYAIFGCTDEEAVNYNPNATDDDGSCFYVIFGCIDVLALNFNPDANTDDGSCIYPPSPPNVCDDPLIFVPNTFTPNNDGVNDVFQVIAPSECFRRWETLVWNRWGQIVWQADSPSAIWMGESLRGTHYVSDGVYVYKIDAEGVLPSATQSLQGHLTIFR